MEKEFVTVYHEIADSYLENLSYTYYVHNDSLSLEHLKITDISQIKGLENLTTLRYL